MSRILGALRFILGALGFMAANVLIALGFVMNAPWITLAGAALIIATMLLFGRRNPPTEGRKVGSHGS